MEFRGEHNRKLSTRKEMRWGAKGSFSLVIVGSKDGLWFDHEIGRGGDIIEFIKVERGCSFVEALDHAAQYVSKLRNGLYSSRPVSRPTLWQTVDSDDEKRIEQALGIWCEARPLTATLAETYLRSRCIEVPGEALDALRFHPRCPWWVGTRLAMVALIRDIITDEPIGIHRTALTADGRKLDRPKLLGPTAGGAIKLSGDYVVGEVTIAEGIETALSAAQLNFETCHYQQQKMAARAVDIVYCAHEALFQLPERSASASVWALLTSRSGRMVSPPHRVLPSPASRMS
jgi:putative DNA primase/helicase